MASISMQQGREATGAAYAAARTAIGGHRTAQGLNDQATGVEFTGRITGAEITKNAGIESAKLQAISTIIGRMGAKLAQDIEKGMEMRYWRFIAIPTVGSFLVSWKLDCYLSYSNSR